jgi:hypothetical protein
MYILIQEIIYMFDIVPNSVVVDDKGASIGVPNTLLTEEPGTTIPIIFYRLRFQSYGKNKPRQISNA